MCFTFVGFHSCNVTYACRLPHARRCLPGLLHGQPLRPPLAAATPCPVPPPIAIPPFATLPHCPLPPAIPRYEPAVTAFPYPTFCLRYCSCRTHTFVSLLLYTFEHACVASFPCPCPSVWRTIIGGVETNTSPLWHQHTCTP